MNGIFRFVIHIAGRQVSERHFWGEGLIGESLRKFDVFLMETEFSRIRQEVSQNAVYFADGWRKIEVSQNERQNQQPIGYRRQVGVRYLGKI